MWQNFSSFINFSFVSHSPDISYQTNGLEPPDVPSTTDQPRLILPYEVDCDPTANSLNQCKYTPKSGAASKCSGPVNIYCKDGTKIRLAQPSLTGSTDPEDSELLVFMNDIGQWSTVCSKDWTAGDNSLACESAGKVDPFDRAQARSCWEHWFNHLHLDWKAHSGYYLIYSTILERVIPVHCDMEMDSGGWTLVFAADYTNVTADWSAATMPRKNRYDPPDNTNLFKDYSILDLADSFQVSFTGAMDCNSIVKRFYS